jgi:predicted DNA-binding transcriptional regulator YafY
MPAFMALALRLSEKHLKQVLPSETQTELKKLFKNAQEKLVKSDQKLSSRHYQRLSQSVEFFQRGQRLQAAPLNPLILDAIYRAILLGKRITINYQRGPSIKEYELHPYGVVIMLPKLYLVAKKHEESPEHKSFRSFLIHKIQNVTIKQQANHVPDDFDLRHYLDTGHMDVYLSSNDQKHHNLLLEISVSQHSNLIEDLKENPINPDQELQQIDDKTWHLTASVKRTIQLKNWLMALGNQAKILSPKIIQEDLIQAIDAIRARY